MKNHSIKRKRRGIRKVLEKKVITIKDAQERKDLQKIKGIEVIKVIKGRIENILEVIETTIEEKVKEIRTVIILKAKKEASMVNLLITQLKRFLILNISVPK